MLAVRVLAIVAGTGLVALNLFDVFQAVILPRATSIHWRISARMVRATWPAWRRYGQSIADADRRENVLGMYAPLALVAFLLVWGLGCILGYGLILYGLRDEVRPIVNLGEATYLAGTSFLTIGYGDFVPTGGTSRFVCLCAGASGFAIVAIVTAFLFQVFGAFAARERFVVALGARAGSPPSGVTLLESYARFGIAADIDDVFEEATAWASSVLESHIAYPILAYFRSSHDYESWIAALGALLDAAALKLTLVADTAPGHAKIFNNVGRHLVHDVSTYFALSGEPDPGVERHEFDTAHARLKESGYALRDSDAAWEKFAETRSAYAPALNALAQYWSIPPAQWIGDRSLLPKPHRLPVRAVETVRADRAS